MAAARDTHDYRALFLSPTPMIDLRAPVEFARGAFPTSISLPLMTNDERAEVGTCYKQQGQAAAIELGHTLVAGAVREARIEGWLDFTRDYPQGCLYCWRGGLRSQTVQQWLQDAGVQYTRVTGGYKAMRRFLLDALEQSTEAMDCMLVSGPTGSGKTRVIERLGCAVDLEGLANHRGSSFGQLPAGQPSQIDFENSVSIALLRLLAAGKGPVFIEDEGRLIGRLSLPIAMSNVMARAPLVLVQESLAQRTEVVLQDYIIDLGRRYFLLFDEQGPQRHAEKMQADLVRIGKRLGGARLARVAGMMTEAFDAQWRSGDLEGHRQWISFLLAKYYDPMYEYQLSRRQGEVVFRGEREAVVAWAREAAIDASAA